MTTPDQTAQKPAPLVVYFDGACPLCCAEISYYRALPGGDALRFVDVSMPAAATGPDLDRATAMARFHVRRADGDLLSGARGFVELWRHLPSWRRLAAVARVPLVIPVLELLYRAFLPVRPHLSRLAARMGAKAINPTGGAPCCSIAPAKDASG